MISQLHAKTMAQYNQWQNRSIYKSASALTDHQRREDKGAFFGSIHTTLAHILWADRYPEWKVRNLLSAHAPGLDG
ncbi:MAG: DinB family protein, partial [Pseudomonadota bacterium]